MLCLVVPHFGNFVRRVRNKLNLSQEAFAHLIGLETREAVWQMERKPERRIRGDTLENILDLFGYGSEQELDEAWKKGTFPDVESIRLRLGKRVPAYGLAGVTAASPVPVPDRSGIDADTLSVDESLPSFDAVNAGRLSSRDVEKLLDGLGPSGLFKVRLDGDSMAPDYPAGCWVVFSRPKAMAEGVVDGKDYLVWTGEDESTFKRVTRDRKAPKDYLILTALNPDREAYPDQRVHRRDVAYLARAVRKDIPIN